MEKVIGLTKNVCIQQAVWQYGGATNIFSTFCSLFGFSSSRRITPGNRINNELLFINLAAVPGWTFFKYRHIAKPKPLYVTLFGHSVTVDTT